MPIFNIQKDALLRLSDSQLEELIAQLAEADLASKGHSLAHVYQSGSINSPDGGIDVRVDVPVDELDTGFLSRPNTIFQAKKKSMSKAEIRKEMRPGGILSSALSKQAEIGGSYIIVSLADDCSEPMRNDRLDAMREAMDGDPNKGSIHLDFFDRSKLLQWLRQHHAVVLWAREILGQSISGWRPYGTWSNPPSGSDDTLILAPGVSVTLPTGTGDKLKIEEAIEPMRELVGSTNRTIRVIGLSGVGKTRIVQSLFDENIGDKALDRTVAIYADSGAGHDPSAVEMLERLIGEKRRAIMVLDNCSSSLHADLASKVTSANSQITLITVEYDIREDNPQSTDVIRIDADGPALAEKLLRRRFPSIHQGNARRIAEFASGNARVALAVAERVEEGVSLAHLSDAQLFERLFEQKNQPNDNLRAHAEVLSLVYSFSVSSANGSDTDELAVLGSLCKVPREQLFRSVATLFERDIVQKRSHWRAILPHAIANRLAKDALKNVPKENLRGTFEATGHERLLMSFAHRLGLMHDHPIAREIVQDWLEVDGPGGLWIGLSHHTQQEIENESLDVGGKLLTPHALGALILEYVTPIVPCAILDRLETKIKAPGFEGFGFDRKLQRTILDLLRSLAYDADKFDRCVELLLQLVEATDDVSIDNIIRNIIGSLFQAHLSGTHASLNQRLSVVREAIRSTSEKRQEIGFLMLSAALAGPPWSSSHMNDFGARSRDFGFQPNHDELVDWRNNFMDLAVELDRSEKQDIASSIRAVLAQMFRCLWDHPPIRKKLIEVARSFNDRQQWIEGWKVVRDTICFDVHEEIESKENMLHSDKLQSLEVELAPKCLLDKIKVYVLSGYDPWSLDDEFNEDDPHSEDKANLRLAEKSEKLGEEFARSGQPIALLGRDLLTNNGNSFLYDFGKGLAKRALNVERTWEELIDLLHQFSIENFNVSVFRGLIEVVGRSDRLLAQGLLDQCLDEPLLRRNIVLLHPSTQYNTVDFNRCIKALDGSQANLAAYGDILWKDNYSSLPKKWAIEIANQLLEIKGGETIVLFALSKRFSNKNLKQYSLDSKFLAIGFRAAKIRLRRNQQDWGGTVDVRMSRFIKAAFKYEGDKQEKVSWIDAVFDAIDANHGNLIGFNSTIDITARNMPSEFLDRVFSGDEETETKRWNFVMQGRRVTEQSGRNRSPIEAIDIDVLIDWCKMKDNLKVWTVVASGIFPWKKNMSDGLVEISDVALNFLEAAPNKEDILRAYLCKIIPRASFRDGGELMQRRALAITKLNQHSNQDIVSASLDISEEISKVVNDWIKMFENSEMRIEEKFE